MWPFRKRGPATQAISPVREIGDLVDQIKRTPIRFSHDCTVTHIRKIPRPTMMRFWVKDPGSDGREFCTPPIDLSFKTSTPIYFPLVWVTGRQEDNGRQVEIRTELHYDPRDMP
jgi:hypothetical protein